MYLKKNILISLSILLVSCSPYKKQDLLDSSLEIAGNNRIELEKVISHYKNDKQKTKAVVFLTQNMIGKYYLYGNNVSEFHSYIDSMFQISSIEYNEKNIYSQYINQAKHIQDRSCIFMDLQTIKANFMIKQIDESFKFWQKPWNQFLSFENFCELILPYRIGNEILEDWRPLYQAQFSKLLNDSIANAKEACIAVNNKLKDLPIHIFLTSVRPSDIRPSSLINIKFGLCEDYAALAVFTMRSVGIPVAIEFIPHWGKGNSNHTFNSVYNDDKKYYDFSGGEQNPGEHLSRFDGIPKVYRRTFGLQRTSLALTHGAEAIPPFFKNPCIIDVTNNYPFIHSQNISIKLPEDKPNKKFAYLCVFDPTGWFPVDWGEIKKGYVTFKNVGPDIIYQVACYNESQLSPLSSPFYVDSCGVIKTIDCKQDKISIHLERKQKEASNLAFVPLTMIGAKFQASDFSDFRIAEDLYTFTSAPNFKYTTIETEPRKSYKYYRYLSSRKTQGNMAEVEFYDKKNDEIVTGKVIGTDITSIYHPDAVKNNVFDRDALTFFHTRDTLSWAGLALDNPVRINKIRYIIRNDDNGVRKNNLYELFYIDESKQWTSAGRKIATEDDMIIFDNIPAGTLYWLRNHTRGREERIFTYENGKQIWW